MGEGMLRVGTKGLRQEGRQRAKVRDRVETEGHHDVKVVGRTESEESPGTLTL